MLITQLIQKRKAITARIWNHMVQEARAMQPRAGEGMTQHRGRSGIRMHARRPASKSFVVLLGAHQGSGRYAWEERKWDHNTQSWITPTNPRSGNYAYNLAGKTGLAGKRVRIHPLGKQKYYFEFIQKGNPCSGHQFCVNVYQQQGNPFSSPPTGPPIPGATVAIRTAPADVFVVSGTTDSEGRVCLNVPTTGSFNITACFDPSGAEPECCRTVNKFVNVPCGTTEVSIGLCCSRVCIHVTDYETGSPLAGATVYRQPIFPNPDYTLKGTSDGNGDACFYYPVGQDLLFIVGKTGFYGTMVCVDTECLETAYTEAKLYDSANWVHNGCYGFYHCQDQTERDPAMIRKVLYVTFTGPAAIFGPWSGVTIPLTLRPEDDPYQNPNAGISKRFESGCLTTGGEYWCHTVTYDGQGNSTKTCEKSNHPKAFASLNLNCGAALNWTSCTPNSYFHSLCCDAESECVDDDPLTDKFQTQDWYCGDFPACVTSPPAPGARSGFRFPLYIGNQCIADFELSGGAIGCRPNDCGIWNYGGADPVDWLGICNHGGVSGPVAYSGEYWRGYEWNDCTYGGVPTADYVLTE